MTNEDLLRPFERVSFYRQCLWRLGIRGCWLVLPVAPACPANSKNKLLIRASGWPCITPVALGSSPVFAIRWPEPSCRDELYIEEGK